MRKSISNKNTAAKKIINDFFSDYSCSYHADLLYDVMCICALDEKFGLSDNRKYSLVEFLERCSKFINAVSVLTNFSEALSSHYPKPVHIDRGKASQVENEINNLSKPFWDVLSSDQRTRARLKAEKYSDLIVLKGTNRDKLLSQDSEFRFFMRYGLKESIDLIDQISKNYLPKSFPQGKNGEVSRFTRDLKHLLAAIYLKNTERSGRVGGAHD